MQCPACKTVNLAMTDRQGIEIDYCPQCRGVWLDRGELDRLIERAGADVPAQRPDYRPDERHAPRPHGHHDAPGYGHKPRKPKSLLGELFDF